MHCIALCSAAGTGLWYQVSSWAEYDAAPFQSHYSIPRCSPWSGDNTDHDDECNIEISDLSSMPMNFPQRALVGSRDKQKSVAILLNKISSMGPTHSAVFHGWRLCALLSPFSLSSTTTLASYCSINSRPINISCGDFYELKSWTIPDLTGDLISANNLLHLSSKYHLLFSNLP